VAPLRQPFWTSRRTADAVGVRSWVLHPREKNVTVQAAIKAVQETQHELEWSFLEDSHHAGNWAAIMAYAVTDVNYWISVEEEKSVATISTV
jgi:phage gp46-like protein